VKDGEIISARVVYVRNRTTRKKDYLVLLTTDMNISEGDKSLMHFIVALPKPLFAKLKFCI